ncbi:MAG TPA: hypothetical protein VK509_18930, partial [Polyangiales bacterium]|nr:hypothetical protein [Polyangiales bacterium]
MTSVPLARIGALCALALCGPLPGCDGAKRDATVPAPAPAASSTARRAAPALPVLPALQRARLEYLFEAGALLARGWPQLSRELPCVLLVDMETQWLVGCERAPSAGFVQLAERVRGRPLYARASTRVNVAGLDVATRDWLELAAATARVEPRDPHATKPDGPGLMVIGTLEAVRSARHDFRDCMTEEWISVALHELMHVWQQRSPAFADELRAIAAGTFAPDAIRALFVGDARYRALVEREYRLLVDAAAGSSDRAAAQRTLRKWRTLYAARRALLAARADGEQLVRADRVFTQLEGVARYVESRFLVDPSMRPT